jgi:cell division protein FtsA
MLAECRQIQISSGSDKKVEILDVLPQEYLVDDCMEHDAVGFCCRNLQGKYRVVVALADLRRNLIRAIKEKAGVEIAGLFISPRAMSDTMLTPKEKELGSVFLDFGAGTTSVSIYENHYLRYVAVVPFGGNELTEDLRELNLVTADAEKLKLNHGNAMSELETDTNIYVSPVSVGMQGLEISTHLTASILEARLAEILGFVQKHIEKSGYSGRLRSGVVIGGGASNLKNINELVSRELGMKVRHCNYDVETQIENFDYHSFAQLIALLNFAQISCVKIKEQPKIEVSKTPSIFGKIMEKTGIKKAAGKVKQVAEEGLVDMFNDDANGKMREKIVDLKNNDK